VLRKREALKWLTEREREREREREEVCITSTATHQLLMETRREGFSLFIRLRLSESER
jgi:hypothetical protein